MLIGSQMDGLDRLLSMQSNICGSDYDPNVSTAQGRIFMSANVCDKQDETTYWPGSLENFTVEEQQESCEAAMRERRLNQQSKIIRRTNQ